MAAKVEHAEVTPAKLRELLALREKATSGPWHMKSGGLGGMFRSFFITTWWRERHDCKDGDIASVSATRTIYEEDRGRHSGRTRTSFEHTIKTAEHDAKLIVEAVNWLEPMAKALLSGEQLDETAWLLEYPADKYGPIRYFAAGEPPVITASDATRFSREADAKAIERVLKLTGCSPVEHRWMTAKAKAPQP